MMAADTLPLDVLEGQLDTFELLNAMYPDTSEERPNDDSQAIVASLRQWLENKTPSLDMPKLPDSLSLIVVLDIVDEDPAIAHQSLTVNVTLPLRKLREEGKAATVEPGEFPLYKIRVSKPEWLTKGETALLTQDMPQDDIVSALESITNRAQEASLATALQHNTTTTTTTASLASPLIRVWFYFPSISTRSKRNDLIHYGPTYHLTGFLLAGKPGILCLEGTASDIDAYMRFIKTESWGDIPSGHKKVSEKWREEGEDVKRCFEGMEEITEGYGIERRGMRGNRGDMYVFLFLFPFSFFLLLLFLDFFLARSSLVGKGDYDNDDQIYLREREEIMLTSPPQ